MKVVIIGTGNVATVLGKRIQEAGHEIIQVIGRNFEKAESLAGQLQTRPAYNIRYINLGADIYIVAVSDTAISPIANQLRLRDKIVVHTAAAVSKDVFAGSAENFGVLYPLQTLVKDMPQPSSIPVLIDSNNEITKKALKDFASTWSDMVRSANDDERLKLHIAAVFVSNFSNYLFTVADEFCKREHLKFNLLYPLIEETVKKIKVHSPSAVQTGPAVREDFSTIEKHKEVLNNYPELSNLYNLLTTNLIKLRSENNTLI
jgi:predicted short-subunit dehydrogenase-like oxidoreductase (DUF2520 family)